MKKFIYILSVIACTSLAAIEQPQEDLPRSPVLSTSAIIEVYKGTFFEGIVLVRHQEDPYSYFLPGSLVPYGDQVEDTLRSEARGELNLELKELSIFRIYSDPNRDPRCHVVDITYLTKVGAQPVAGVDVLDAKVFGIDHIPWTSLGLDHAQIIRDYLKGRSVLDPFKHAFKPPF